MKENFIKNTFYYSQSNLKGVPLHGQKKLTSSQVYNTSRSIEQMS